MSKSVGNGKRALSFWKSDSPLTSKRVSQMLSNPKDAEALIKAVRKVRNGLHTNDSTPVSFRADVYKK
jgi:hypothetical protein